MLTPPQNRVLQLNVGVEWELRAVLNVHRGCTAAGLPA